MDDIATHLRGHIVGIGETNLCFEPAAVTQRHQYQWYGHNRVVTMDNDYHVKNNSSSGVGMWIHDSIARHDNCTITNTAHDCDRRIWSCINGTRDTYVCFVYGPVYNASQQRQSITRQFWSDLIAETQRYSLIGDVVVMGDLNARIGMDSGDDRVNNNQHYLNDYLAICGMSMINNTSRCHASNGPWTWRRGTHHSVIDYVLVSSSAVARVQRMSISWSDNCGSDHAVLRLWWSRQPPRVNAPDNNDRRRANGQCNTRVWSWKWPHRLRDWHPFNSQAATPMDEWLARVYHDHPPDSFSHSFPHDQRVAIMNDIWLSWRYTVESVMRRSFGSIPVVIGSKRHRQRVYNPELQQLLQQRDKLHELYSRAFAARGPSTIVTNRPQLSAANQQRQQWRATVASAWSAYVRQRRIVKKWLTRHRWAQRDSDLQLIDELRVDDSARWWQLYKQIYRTPSPPLPVTMLRSDGTRTSDIHGTLKQWSEYYRLLGADNQCERFDHDHYQRANNAVRDNLVNIDTNISPHAFRSFNHDITALDITKARDAVRNHRAAGPDQLRSDIIVSGWPSLSTSITHLIQCAWRTICIPDAWCDSTVTPLLKSGDAQQCTNYRPISLTPVVMKLYERVLADRVSRVPGMPDSQGGFRQGRGPIDHAFILRELMLREHEQHRRVFVAFLDLKSAYDLTWRNGLLHHLWRVRGITGRMWYVIADMYRRTRSRVRVNGRLSPWYDTHIGLRQGSVLSPILFASFISDLDQWLTNGGHHGVRVSNIQPWPPQSDDALSYPSQQRRDRTRVPRSSINCLLYADDIALVASSYNQLVAMVQSTVKFAHHYRFTFNASKSGWLASGTRTAAEGTLNTRPIDLDGTMMSEVASYRYLGIDITPDLQSSVHCLQRGKRAMKAIYQLYRLGKWHHGLRIRIGRIVATVLARSGLMWASEILREPTLAQMAHLERPWIAIARYIMGASQSASHDTLLSEIGWWRIADHYTLAKVNYFNRLRVGGVGLASWMWRVRMGDAYQRIFHDNSRRSLDIAHLDEPHAALRPHRQQRHIHQARNYSRLNDIGTTVPLPRSERCDSDDDDSKSSRDDPMHAQALVDRPDAKRGGDAHEYKSIPQRSSAADVHLNSIQGHALSRPHHQHRRRLPTAFCESLFYLFHRYGDSKEWFADTHASQEMWSGDYRNVMLKKFAEDWRMRVAATRRGTSIYLHVQPSRPYYYKQRAARRGRANGEDDVAIMFHEEQKLLDNAEQLSPLAHHHNGNGSTRAMVTVLKYGHEPFVEEQRGGLYRLGARWLARFRTGDVPLNAMRAAVYDGSGVNDVSIRPSTINPMCMLCDMNAYDDYNHVLLECPAFTHARDAFQPDINSASAAIIARGESIHTRVVVPPDQPAHQPTHARQCVVIMDDDTQQLFVAASQYAVHDNANDSNDNHDDAATRATSPTLPWQWWLRSPVVAELLSNSRYADHLKLFLARVMTRRWKLVQAQQQRQHATHSRTPPRVSDDLTRPFQPSPRDRRRLIAVSPNSGRRVASLILSGPLSPPSSPSLIDPLQLSPQSPSLSSSSSPQQAIPWPSVSRSPIVSQQSGTRTRRSARVSNRHTISANSW